ncbi:deoxyuridine 5'-triphosphate nucleotidohydrolase [Candidatus Desantisbacteria bacterium CG1_02_38_46]|uniref:Deoxyuridine 5'-triphosphate nucleotidohydrolase n=3 Tax=unclassified Candidatus Desantisiibacteriota TaxID=3106372 RepID=A0A2H9PC19_9BACT|nr:MAG: deoxyuridine 5'-triphosphate nucleotidohydrolase [Candidatus Desantisbacteria bacterium CG1_02_38_46]PIU51066.1 MAG: dUTP diphosphatase [Candidatus Desantisbacteria bacterium CG07_land_8_20_14_0_80_39_15]PIZ16608.1 MAG: dUTP diphosphatase [Candidatus Desantisbacteria bacterium CG_4_10_14_0_8_um_filter_39_17]
MKKVKILLEKITKNATIPRYMSKKASGMDLYACVSKKVILRSFERKLIPTGIRISVPRGYEVQIRPRSGLAWEYGVGVLNSPGTVDSDYRGEVKVILINLGKSPFVIKPNDRIAQMVLNKVEQIDLKVVKSLENTERGCGGFGHTGR